MNLFDSYKQMFFELLRVIKMAFDDYHAWSSAGIWQKKPNRKENLCWAVWMAVLTFLFVAVFSLEIIHGHTNNMLDYNKPSEHQHKKMQLPY